MEINLGVAVTPFISDIMGGLEYFSLWYAAILCRYDNETYHVISDPGFTTYNSEAD